MFILGAALELARRSGGAVVIPFSVATEAVAYHTPFSYFELFFHKFSYVLDEDLERAKVHAWVEPVGASAPVQLPVQRQNDLAVEYLRIDGYFQRLFHLPPRSVLLEHFALLPEFLAEAQKTHATVLDLPSTVAVHIRRGDFVPGVRTADHMTLDEFKRIQKYTNQAIEDALRELPGCTLVFFSDDIAWVEQNYSLEGAERRFVNETRDWVSLWLMSQCKHHILAPSTFSWWAAYLSPHHGIDGHRVFIPDPWHRIPYYSCPLDALCPREWTRVRVA